MIHSCFPYAASPTSYPLSPTRRSSDLELDLVAGAALLGAEQREYLRLQDIAAVDVEVRRRFGRGRLLEDRKSTRLNSSHRCISYAVFCLKKKKEAHCVRRHGTSGQALS